MHAVRQRDEGQVHLHLHHAPPQPLLVRGLDGVVVAAIALCPLLATLFAEASVLLNTESGVCTTSLSWFLMMRVGIDVA